MSPGRFPGHSGAAGPLPAIMRRLEPNAAAGLPNRGGVTQ